MNRCKENEDFKKEIKQVVETSNRDGIISLCDLFRYIINNVDIADIAEYYEYFGGYDFDMYKISFLTKNNLCLVSRRHVQHMFGSFIVSYMQKNEQFSSADVKKMNEILSTRASEINNIFNAKGIVSIARLSVNIAKLLDKHNAASFPHLVLISVLACLNHKQTRALTDDALSDLSHSATEVENFMNNEKNYMKIATGTVEIDAMGNTADRSTILKTKFINLSQEIFLGVLFQLKMNMKCDDSAGKNDKYKENVMELHNIIEFDIIPKPEFRALFEKIVADYDKVRGRVEEHPVHIANFVQMFSEFYPIDEANKPEEPEESQEVNYESEEY